MTTSASKRAVAAGAKVMYHSAPDVAPGKAAKFVLVLEFDDTALRIDVCLLHTCC